MEILLNLLYNFFRVTLCIYSALDKSTGYVSHKFTLIPYKAGLPKYLDYGR
jgi:hypothetical protein